MDEREDKNGANGGNCRSLYIITPTYNEAGSIGELIERIFKLNLPCLKKLIVIDDNSPDGTGRIAEGFAKHYPVEVINRSGKNGLGTAYAETYAKITAMPPSEQPDCVAQMDADLSHEPEELPAMLAKLDGCDMVIGSRYVSGGSIRRWNILRRFLSMAGNLYARLILGLPQKDITSGFKCMRTSIINNLDWNGFSSAGYNFQIETIHKAAKKGYKVKEHPISFTERKTGSSKINLPIILESFYKVLLLKLNKI